MRATVFHMAADDHLSSRHALLVLDEDIVVFLLYFYRLTFRYFGNGIGYSHVYDFRINADRVHLIVDTMDMVVFGFKVDGAQHF